MPVPLINFPISAVVDVLLSYTQWVFSNPEITPAEYRWNSDDRKSKIRISAPFVIDNEKPMSAPFIVIERGGFTFANRTIDNVKSGGENTFINTEKVDWCNGSVNVICGSRVAGEASSLANFLAIMFQADRHGIIKESKFIRNLNYSAVGPEIPVVKDVEVRRWEVTLSLSTSLQIGWFETELDPVEWNSAEIYQTEDPPVVYSDKGSIAQGSNILTDITQDFGHLNTSNPQLLEQDLGRGFYYIRFKNNPNAQLYTIKSPIISGTEVELLTHDEDGNTVPWVAEESQSNVEYDLLWNSLHIHMKLPTSG